MLPNNQMSVFKRKRERKRFKRKNVRLKPHTVVLVDCAQQTDPPPPPVLLKPSPLVMWKKVDPFSEMFQKLTNDLLHKKAIPSPPPPSTTTSQDPSPPATFACDRTRSVDVLTVSINTIEDLLEVADLYTQDDFAEKNYTVNIGGLHRMKPALTQLQNMIGLGTIKAQLIEHILFFSQELHENNPTSSEVLAEDCNADMFHTVIYGRPGVGKTVFARILAKVYLALGITKRDVFVTARRTDLIGEYLGHTAVKTQKKIDESLGGVLFIDEAYSLGSSTDYKTCDSYSKECIDTLNQNLTEKKKSFVCIIAGYKEEITKNLFAVNPGLKRRFPFVYELKGYSPSEMLAILRLKVSLIQWSIHVDCDAWLEKKPFFSPDRMEKFPNFAGDIETLVLNIKIAHSRRIFGKDVVDQKILTIADMDDGYQRYLEYRGTNTANNNSSAYLSMFC